MNDGDGPRGVLSTLTSQKRALGCLFGTWLLSVFTQGYIIVPASVLTTISEDLSIQPSLAIWIVSATTAAWAFTNFLNGIGIERVGDFYVITIATAVFVVTCAWGWWAGSHQQFWSLMASRFLAGVAIGALWTASANVVGRVFPAHSQGSAIGFYTTSAPAGFAIGQFSTPLIAAQFDWSVVFLGIGALSVASFAVFTASLRGVDLEPVERSSSVFDSYSEALTNRAVLFGCAIAFAAYSYYLFMNSWMPTYLNTEFSLSLELSGLLTALFPAMGVLSRAGGGLISDRLLGQRRIPVLRYAFYVSLPIVGVVALTETVSVLVVSLLVAGFTIQLTFGVLYSYVREVVSAEMSGTALAFLGTAGIFGAFSAPIVTGALIGATDTYAVAFGYAAALALAGLVLSRMAPESRPG